MNLPHALPAVTLCELQDPGLRDLESWSPFCVKVHRALRLLGVPYQRRLANRPSDHRALNPTGQVPVLLLGDEVVADSTEILTRLDALVPSVLVPRDTRAAAEAWHWEDYADAALSGFLVAARWADDRNWPRTREAYFGAMPAPLRLVIPGRIRAHVVESLVARDLWRAGPDACWRRFERALDQLEARAPKVGFWIDERPSVADLSLFAMLHGLRSPLTPAQASTIATRPALTAWLDRVHEATWTSRAALAA